VNKKHSVAILSTSALAAGMAQGAVIHSGPLNIQITCPDDWNVAPAEIDMNGDFITDFKVGFDGYLSSNWRKPFVDCRQTSGIYGSLPRTQADSGVPVTPFGTMIDANYLAPTTSEKAYLSQNGDGGLVGEWPHMAMTEGYVGVELFDVSNSTTNFGWIHLVYSSAMVADPPVLTLVDWGYETTPGVGIPAGSTNTLGIPQIYSAPASQTVPMGAGVTMKVSALGQPTPSYQWRAGAAGSGNYTNLVNGGNISGATTAALQINGAAPANAADYVVVISNSAGAVTSSPPATLTVGPPAVAPAAQALFSGVTARFKVDVASGLTPTYQWRRGNVNLSDGGKVSGAATAHLQVSGLAMADAGNYDVVLTLGSTVRTSTVSALTVLPVENAYETALLSAGPVAYYPLNETGNPAAGNLRAMDGAGAFDGTYGNQVLNGYSGTAGPRAADGFPGFGANNRAAKFTPQQSGSRIVVAPWKLNTDTLTLLAWMNPVGDQRDSAGVIYTLSSNQMVAGLNYFWVTNSTTGVHSIGYNWRDQNDIFWDSAFSPPPGQWSLVALIVEPTRAGIYIFNANGFAFRENTGLTPRVPVPFDVPEHIGTDPSYADGRQNFNGTIDEVAVFNRALSQAELQAIYNGALASAPPPTIEITRSGGSVQLTWPRGLLLEASAVNGPWSTNSTAVSPYTTPASQTQKFYRVVVP
jgi:hypothetical protein